MSTTIRPEILRHMSALPDHPKMLMKVMEFFSNQPGIEGAFVSGSSVNGPMDEFSDLDCGFLCKDEAARETLWQQRWDWKIAPWFHRFDADHIKPYFIIYFFEPSMHVDLNFYVKSDLPGFAGAPFTVAFDRSNTLDRWAAEKNVPQIIEPDWSTVEHDDERFWAWIHYCCTHALRGEFYDSAYFMRDLRAIVEKWEAYINNRKYFDPRRAEAKFAQSFLNKVSHAFCKPERASIRQAFENLIALQLEQRKKIEQKVNVKWKTTPTAIQHMWDLVQKL